MSDLYGKTTESLESLDKISCTPLRRGTSGKIKKGKGEDIELAAVDDGTEKETSELVSAEVVGNQTTSSIQKLQNVVRVINAKNVFSVPDPKKQKLRVERQRLHLQKFSRVRGDNFDEDNAAKTSSQHQVNEDRKQYNNYRREYAAKVLFKAGVNKLRTKPKAKKFVFDNFGGRSFLNIDLNDSRDDAEFSSIDFDFFNFSTKADIRNEIEEEEEEEEEIFLSASAVPNRNSSFDVKNRKTQRIRLGSLLGSDLKHNIASKFKSNDYEERTYFTFWVSFVQLVTMVVVLCIYSFAPIGKDVKVVKREVLLSREGVTSFETLSRKVVESFWLGPSPESLILLGAKYAPCMRRDVKVYAEIDKERQLENSTGCCMQATVADGCIQREKKYCLSPYVQFTPGRVCGQDRAFCIKASIPPSAWDPRSITKWPKCEAHRKVPENQDNRHMTCTVTGRPCCINTQGQCVITTEDNCRFWNGIYHGDATLCSQVDCLAATCGNSFYNDNQPDQIYRLLISLFLCAGILHLIIVLIFNITLLRYIEVYAGWFRTSVIFFLSGIGGNLWSAILLPYQAEVGESGAMFGIFACIFVEGIQNWKSFERPWHYIAKLTGILLVAFLFGLLPYVDNTAHIFGFIYGLFLGFFLLPYVPVGNEEDQKKENKKYWILSIISLIIVILLFVLGFVLFYFKQDLNSNAIALFNCPLGEKLCRNFNQGIKLESRDIEY